MASIATLSRLSAVMTLDVTAFMASASLVDKKLKAMRANAVAFGQGFSRTFSLAFALVGAAAIKVAADFDQLQAQLEAVTGGDGLSDLTDQARRLGRETVFTATEIANLQLELAKLGFSSEEVARSVEASSKISAVFGGELVKTGTTIAEAVRQFSRENLDAARVADVMAVAFQKTALSTDNFGQAMKNVGSVANITGNDFVTTVALLGQLANAGQKGGIAGTRLKGVFIRLGKQMGVTGEELDLLTSGQLDFNQLIEIFRNRAGVAAAVISELGDEFQVLKQQLIDSNGAAAALASGLSERLFFSLKRITAATEGIGITLGNAFGPILETVAQSLSDFAKFLEETDRGTLRLVVSLGTFLAIVPLLTVALTALGSVLLFVFNASGIGPVVAGLTALVTILLAARAELGLTVGVIQDAKDANADLSETLNDAASKSVEDFTKRLEVLNEELDKVAGDDRLDAAEKLIASEKLNEAIGQLSGKLEDFSSFDTSGFDKAIQEFNQKSQNLSLLKAENFISQEEVNKSIKEAERLMTAEINGVPVFNVELEKKRLEVLQGELSKLQIAEAFFDLDDRNIGADLQDAIDDLDLSIFSPAQIQAEKTKLASVALELEAALLRVQESTGNFFSNLFTNVGVFLQFAIDSLLTLTKVFGGFNEAAVAASDKFYNSLVTTENTLKRIAEIEAQIAANKLLQEKFQRELNKRNEENLALAEEAQKLSDIYVNLFNSEDAAAEAIEAFNKLKEKLKEVAAEFSLSEGNIKAAADTISQLSNSALDLKSVLQTNDFEVDLGFEEGDIENRIAALKSASSALGNFIAEQIALERFDLAAIFLSDKEAADLLVKSLERTKKIADNLAAGAERDTILDALLNDDLIEKSVQLREKIQTLKARYELFIKEGQAGTLGLANTIKLLEAELLALGDAVKAIDIKIDLGLEDQRLLLDGLGADLRKTNDLLEREMTAALDAVQVAFNKLEGKGSLLSDAFDLGDSEGVLDISELTTLLEAAELAFAGATEGTEAYTRALAERDNLLAFQAALLKANGLLDENTSKILANRDALKLQSDQQSFTTSLNDADLTQQFDAGFISLTDFQTQRLDNLKQSYLEAFNNPEVLSGQAQTLSGIQGQIEALETLVIENEKMSGIMSFVQQQTAFIGDAFIAAAKDGKDFFEVLKDGFLNMFYALIGKLIALIALFVVLNILTAGAFMAGGSANTNFAQFLGQGLGIPSGGTQASDIGNLFNKSMQGGMVVEGSISGNNIVLANQRGTRAIDRTFG